MQAGQWFTSNRWEGTPFVCRIAASSNRLNNDMKWIAFLCVFVVELISGSNTTTYAFDDKRVHPGINTKAAMQSSLDIYLKDVVGFPEGQDTTFADQTILTLIEEGGIAEDRLPRFFNHFHDPLEPWENAGLSWAPGIRPAR
jgi:hypothetical protein